MAAELAAADVAVAWIGDLGRQVQQSRRLGVEGGSVFRHDAETVLWVGLGWQWRSKQQRKKEAMRAKQGLTRIWEYQAYI